MKKAITIICSIFISGIASQEYTKSEFKARAKALEIIPSESLDGYHSWDQDVCYTWQDIELILFNEIQKSWRR